LRILILNWRYVDHPRAGGAETLTHGILRLLVEEGHEATCFTATYPGAASEGEIDGVRIVRRGRQWTVHAHAWWWLRRRRRDFDRVVDQINTIPFFTPLYVAKPQRRFLIYQLAREYWWRETRGLFRLISPIGYAAEPLYLRAYRRTPCLTISRSTADDMVSLGFRRSEIAIIPLAIESDPVAALQRKPSGFRLIVVGRLTPAKFIEEAMLAFAMIQREIPEATLDVVGSGDEKYARRLERLATRKGMREVTFHGRVSTERRQELFERAHVHLFASHREGWGLTVSEAGAAGTPSVGYDAPGVRDSIADARFLAPIGDSAELANRALLLARDPELYARARQEAYDRARSLTFDRSAEVFLQALGKPQRLHSSASPGR
jgi:glycosyltransferase involved in cell wall biosynthesis